MTLIEKLYYYLEHEYEIEPSLTREDIRKIVSAVEYKEKYEWP